MFNSWNTSPELYFWNINDCHVLSTWKQASNRLKEHNGIWLLTLNIPLCHLKKDTKATYDIILPSLFIVPRLYITYLVLKILFKDYESIWTVTNNAYLIVMSFTAFPKIIFLVCFPSLSIVISHVLLLLLYAYSTHILSISWYKVVLLVCS